jgi:hypothetical protein
MKCGKLILKTFVKNVRQELIVWQVGFMEYKILSKSGI